MGGSILMFMGSTNRNSVDFFKAIKLGDGHSRRPEKTGGKTRDWL